MGKRRAAYIRQPPHTLANLRAVHRGVAQQQGALRTGFEAKEREWIAVYARLLSYKYAPGEPKALAGISSRRSSSPLNR